MTEVQVEKPCPEFPTSARPQDIFPSSRLWVGRHKHSRPIKSSLPLVTAMGTLVLVLPLMTAPGLQAQSEPATVYNLTSNAPVTVTGNVTCSEKIERSADTAGELKFTNTSSLNIVSFEAVAILRCKGSSPFPINYHFDRLFFEARGLPSEESVSHFVPTADSQESRFDATAAPTPSHVDVEILFVQFEDGSTWGDSRVIGKLRVRRQKIESVLNRLASASDDQEFDSTLTAILSATPQDPVAYTTAYKIGMVRKNSGTESARASVRERLRVAGEREASGKF